MAIPSADVAPHAVTQQSAHVRGWELVDRLATVVMTVCAAAAVVILLLILIFVTLNGLPALNLAFFVERPLPQGEVGGGVAPAILGTIEMLVVAALIGVPFGMATAIYLAEYGRGTFASVVS